MTYRETLLVQSRFSDSQTKIYSVNHNYKNNIHVAYNLPEVSNTNQITMLTENK